MFRSIKRHYYTADGRRIVEILRRQYEQKKLEHVTSKEGVYSLGYTSPNEMYAFLLCLFFD